MLMVQGKSSLLRQSLPQETGGHSEYPTVRARVVAVDESFAIQHRSGNVANKFKDKFVVVRTTQDRYLERFIIETWLLASRECYLPHPQIDERIRYGPSTTAQQTSRITGLTDANPAYLQPPIFQIRTTLSLRALLPPPSRLLASSRALVHAFVLHVPDTLCSSMLRRGIMV
jgi:hypothetical protein